jgi:hypothetical protein
MLALSMSLPRHHGPLTRSGLDLPGIVNRTRRL